MLWILLNDRFEHMVVAFVLFTNKEFGLQVKVWFQNRRMKWKRTKSGRGRANIGFM